MVAHSLCMPIDGDHALVSYHLTKTYRYTGYSAHMVYTRLPLVESWSPNSTCKSVPVHRTISRSS